MNVVHYYSALTKVYGCTMKKQIRVIQLGAVWLLVRVMHDLVMGVIFVLAMWILVIQILII